MKKKTQKSKAMKQQTIHEKAIRLIEGGQVNVDGHCVKLKQTGYNMDCCYVCDMDSICRVNTEMFNVCGECDLITNKNNYLKLVTNDNKVKQ